MDIADHYKDAAKPYPKDENPLLFDLTNYLESAGITDPLIKVSTNSEFGREKDFSSYFQVYSCLPTQEYGPLFVFLSIFSQIPKLAYTKNIGKRFWNKENFLE